MRTSTLVVTLCCWSAAQAVSVNITKYADAACGQPTGAMVADAAGGTPPYTYAWDSGQNTAYIEFLGPGTYTVTVTDAMGEQATASSTVLTMASYPPDYQTHDFVNCAGEYPYAVLYLDDPHLGPSPHVITSSSALDMANASDDFGFTYYYLWFDAAPGSNEQVNWADANGCPGSTNVMLSLDYVHPTLQSLTTTPACNGNNGSVQLAMSMPTGQQVAFRLRHADGSVAGSDQTFSYAFSYTWYSLAPGAYWVLVDPDALDGVPNGIPDTYLECVDSFYVEVPDLSGTCGQVSGSAYYDTDQDCTFDGDEHGIAGRVISFLPGPAYAITNSNGHYSRYIGNGTYTMQLDGTGTDLYPICPNTSTVDVTVSGNTIAQDFADSSLADLDISARIAAGPARPGFQQNVWIEARNHTGRVSGAVDLVLEIDPQLSFVSAGIAPTSVVGNTITWSALPALPAFAAEAVHVLVQVPADVGLIGQPYVHTLTASQTLTETALANNTDTDAGSITGSYDPNEKTVRTSTGGTDGHFHIGEDAWMEYTIGFQNTGNDTAFTVVVRDTLSDALDLATYEQGIASHPFTVTFLPHNVVEWRFANIHLPDSTTNEPLSHGQVSFRIRPKQPLDAGTVIPNVAHIYFDFNPPIRTNDASLVAEFSTGIATTAEAPWRLAPNPATDRVQLLGTSAAGLSYTVITADGRVAASGVVGADRTIPVAALAAGHYTVRFTSKTGVQALRLVKW